MAGAAPLTLAECADGAPLPAGAAALLQSLSADASERRAASDGASPSSEPEASCASTTSIANVTAEDALFALVVVLMAECGFEPATVVDGANASGLQVVADPSTSQQTDAGFDARRMCALRRMPWGWRQQHAPVTPSAASRFEVALALPAFRHLRLRLVAFAVAGALVANVLLPPLTRVKATLADANVTTDGSDEAAAAAGAATVTTTPRSLCLSLVPSRYVEATSPSLGGGWQLRRMAELSLLVKDSLATPARSMVLQHHGARHAALVGLPDEVLLRVASLLPAPSLLALGATCRRLLELSREPSLWRALLRRDFGDGIADADAESLLLDDTDSTTASALTAPAPAAGTIASATPSASAVDPRVTYRRRWERREMRRRVRERWARRARHSDMWLGSFSSDDSDSDLMLAPLHVGSSMPSWFIHGNFGPNVATPGGLQLLASVAASRFNAPPRGRNASTAGALRQHSPAAYTSIPPQPPPLPPAPPPPAPPRGPSPARAFPDVAAEARLRDASNGLARPTEGHPLLSPRLQRVPPLPRYPPTALFTPSRCCSTTGPGPPPPLQRIPLDPWLWDPWASAHATTTTTTTTSSNSSGGGGGTTTTTDAGGTSSSGSAGSLVVDRMRADPWGGRRRRRYRPLAHCCSDRRPLPDVAMLAQFLDAENDDTQGSDT